MTERRQVPKWMRGAMVVGAFTALLYAEHRRPLRRRVERKFRRDTRNMAVAGLSAATLRVLEKPVVEPLADLVQRRRWGLVHRLPLPSGARTVLSILLMDYTLYHWHVLTHRAPFLWRFHLVHHVDLDLSATTALRFHFGEMALSVPYRAAQVLLIGTSPQALARWQTLTLVSIVFHHSNLRLPLWLERSLIGAFVTPRMHGIHHSVLDEERNSNWSSGLTVWDWLHGTLRLDVPQERITIGVPGYSEGDDLALPDLVALLLGPLNGNLVARPSKRPRAG